MIGWSTTTAVFLVRLWTVLLKHDAAATARHATQFDDSRVAADFILLASCLVSLAAVVVLLVKINKTGGRIEGVYTALAITSVVLSWATVHSIFTLRYGHLYYGDEPGISFNDDRKPTYRDFAYVAFTIGMTYQVSDTDLRSPVIRATALRHALLSFLFGTAIIAMTINVVAGLLR
jgi:uncharacterized membrane protein